MKKNELKNGLAFFLVNCGNMHYAGEEGESYLFVNDVILPEDEERTAHTQVILKFNLPSANLEGISSSQRWMYEYQGNLSVYAKEGEKFVKPNWVTEKEVIVNNKQFNKYSNKLNQIPSRFIAG
jgi:hypothetical protein